jgi:heptaprenyl diphosphate synthase
MLSGADREIVETLTKFGEKIGIAFQLADDVIDISSDVSQSGKVPGTDLKEGIPTLVTLQIISSKLDEDQELKLLLQSPIPEEKIADVLIKLRQHSALKDAKNYLHNLSRQAKQLLEPLPAIPARSALEGLCDAVIERTA